MQIVINRLRYAPMRSHSSFDSEEVRLNQAKRHRGFRLVGGGEERAKRGEDERELLRFYLAEVMKSVVGSSRNVGAVSKNVSGSTRCSHCVCVACLQILRPSTAVQRQGQAHEALDGFRVTN